MADGTLKVGTITTSSGSGTITLGQSGETINIPSAATVSGAIANTPNFFVNLSSTQSIPNATSTKVQLNQVLYDSDSGWSTSNYNYTIPTGEAGMYLFTFQCRLNNWDTARFAAHFAKNSTIIAAPETAPDGASYTTAGASIVIDCAAGDVIHLQFFHENGSSQNAYASSTVYGNYLGGYKLIGA